MQSAGRGFRLKSDLLMQEFNRAGPVLHLLLRYTQALITQMSQTAVCNRHHSLDQQLCRWLLLSLDRLHSNELVMTQELIANMLGVRREGVTEAAGRLHKAGLIQYQRGHIVVLDRPQLEERVCECYAVVKKEYDRLLPTSPASWLADRSSDPSARCPRRDQRCALRVTGVSRHGLVIDMFAGKNGAGALVCNASHWLPSMTRY